MLNKYMWKRPGSAKWQLRKPVPSDVKRAYGRPVVTMSLGTEDDVLAAQRALAELHQLEQGWAALRRGEIYLPSAPADSASHRLEPTEDLKRSVIRSVYEQVLQRSEARDIASFAADRADHKNAQRRRREALEDMAREVRAGQLDRITGPVERMLSNRGVHVDRAAAWFDQLTRDAAKAVLDGLDVNLRADEGQIDPQPQTDVVKRAISSDATAKPVDLPFATLVDRFMKSWIAERTSDKETNTEQQKRSTLRLFGGFVEGRPIRSVREDHAASFADTLRLFDPSWARSPETRKLSWGDLVERYGGRDRGLSDATMNRHMQVLQELWGWAKKRGHCEGENPFKGFHKKLRPGINVSPYVAWTSEELSALLHPGPKRTDLLEVMLVAMFTGMRLDEIASLTWAQVRQHAEDGLVVPYFQIEDAKTPAGVRQVPVHSALSWLTHRASTAISGRIWPTFNEEGRGKKPGADAGREFSRFKASMGFTTRAKAFHSFRKNVTRIMERAGVPENDWAQIFGHERGFTYSVYNPDGIDMRRRAEIIALIDYPGLVVPHPTN